ncbi:MAG TPA: tRNA (N6-isopentenyl adenosine(37)-C2)-methylthiotransferase MiaB [Pyrinomonadaceae bacterium]|nr:tRNA (N6-isopentenyl adenosine(37)-C2)-methylthiotransferase MiaB [Pyrinomonadaceae bacterium]
MDKKVVYIETLGCQMNVADSERAATRLRAAGFELCDSPEAANFVILNTCSIREKAERKVFHRIDDIRRERAGSPPVIGLMGCVAQLEGEAIFKNAPAVKMVAGTGAIDRIPQLLEHIGESGRRAIDLEGRRDGETWDASPAERRSKHVAFVPIIEGCNKFCTYCIVPYSRGRERSRIASEIVEEVRKLQREGYKEVQLIGQNVNSYRPKSEAGLESFKGATPFARLLRAVASTGMPRIKFTTSFPRDFDADIVKAIEEHENLCEWIHLPVQSGNDRVLRSMRRGYDVARYLEKVSAIEASRRRLSLTSDIIVGFPGETDAEFEDTLKLVERCRFEGLYIFKYSERKGTPAASMPDTVPEALKTERFRALESLQMSIQREIYGSYVGSVVKVLVEGQSARSPSDLTGHSSCNKVLNFRGPSELAGKIVRVHVTEAKTHSLYGEFSGEA